MVWDYFQQLAAYSLAHNELYGTDIEKGVIMMCSVDCLYQEFVLEGDEFKRAADAWMERVEKFSLPKESEDKGSQEDWFLPQQVVGVFHLALL